MCALQVMLLARLQLAAEESGKSGDVDLAHLLSCHECACNLVQRLIAIERQPVRLVRTNKLAFATYL